ncbi:AAA-domain-containing protein [Rhodofomes roseus]|uniref:AAA-domain-containing protein n=1 Tax=Rhodofomes roseus TaxID=34475 RepID=A0ABQ8KX06_9APHY|nr:AAA-domain-containing protein [Rhodofomes roseus]KAH9843583.1 AAA-domain-containing protein [Rhodofomes roseus]
MPSVEDLEDWPAPEDSTAPNGLATHSTTSNHSQPLKIKIPLKTSFMPPSTRSAARAQSESVASGSEYHESNASMDVDEEPVPVDEDKPEPPQPEYGVTARGRKVLRRSYRESGSEDDLVLDPDRPSSPAKEADGAKDEEEEEEESHYALRRPRKNIRNLKGFVESDEGEGEEEAEEDSGYKLRSRSKNGQSAAKDTRGGRITRRPGSRTQATTSKQTRKRVSTRPTRTRARSQHDDEGYEDEPSSGSADAEGSLDDAPHTSPEPERDGEADAEGEVDVDGEAGQEQEQDERPYAFRKRNHVNYAIPPPLEEMRAPPPKSTANGNRAKGRNVHGRSKVPGWSATGAELSRWMGGAAGDDSDSDYPTRTPRKQPFGAGAMGGGVFAGGAGGLFGDIAAAGTPSNLGKVGDATLADADPLGVNQNVTFDEVGGLDDHIDSLKEMTLLPLLYPEVFQRFNLTPPRGVLFHGPPGTGKTLLARALAASCRSDGKKISFFMRKGADCLSKWVGEAERQLRLLFEEARSQQPSIIFFDEIDGLAPVRSSKQDQIHASIVSTLLALMDGMDGRGQVIVIGATNRPDAIDPALRRPGRFDREFYFPLPSSEARERILRIMTKKWAGWEGETGETNVKGLAKLTKGYGGADLRALCTEAALNAVQRRYPQIYKSNDRLLLKPETIEAELRDFMIAIKKLVPSSARSVSSAASPLPTQLEPLLQHSLDKMKEVIGKVLPVSKKRTALEEAEYEDESTEGALDRELMLQSMETLRVYRPRVVLHGPVGMGQAYVAAAVLHHLEGYHVQSLDLGSLMGDSTRTPEAAIVQLFVEAKRHQPSVIYIPSLVGWCAAVSETTRTTVRAMLDTLAPTDPVLLLAVVDGPFLSLPRDVRSWFGPTRDNRVELIHPMLSQREQFFEGLLKDVRRPPNQFPDGVKRKKRVLEELPIAPPLEPRQPTAAELAVQEESDQRVVTLLRYRLGPILQELKRKFKRFTKRAMEEYKYDFNVVHQEVEVVTTSVEIRTNGDGIVEMTEEQHMEHVDQPQINGINGVHEAVPPPPPPPPPLLPPLFDMDLERMHLELYRNRYLTPDDFLDDIRKIVHNAEVRIDEDPDRLYRAQAMLTAAEVSINDFDPTFRLECQRMAVRERRRRDEYRKNKEKEKEAQEAASQINAPGPRRSTRNNGQPLQISITDPTQLERRRKRHRSTSAANTASEDENGDRASKRSRTEGDGMADGTAATQSPEKFVGVRFADDVDRVETPSLPAPQLNGIHEQMPAPHEPIPGQVPVPEASQYQPQPELEPEYEPPRRTGGFDPSLLNPLPSPSGIAQAGPSSVTLDIQNNPFLSHNTPSIASFASPVADIHSPQPSVAVEPPPPSESPAPVEEAQTSQPDVPMEIHRTPSPVPDFTLDEYLLDDLKRMLQDDTKSLNVEQLEQLRATCLGCVWRHRSEWNRTELIRELMETAKVFIEEVSTDDMDAPSPGL